MARMLRYCLVWLLSFSSLSAFSATRTIILEPGDLQRTYTPGSAPYAFSDSRNWSEPVSVQKNAGRLPVPVTKKGFFTWPNFRGGLKNTLSLSPQNLVGSAALATLFAGIDWLIEDGSVLQRLPGSVDYNGTSTGLAFQGYGTGSCTYYDGKLTGIYSANGTLSAGQFIYMVRSDTSFPAPFTYTSNCGHFSPPRYVGQFNNSGTTAFVESPESQLPLTSIDLDGYISAFDDPVGAAEFAPKLISPLTPDSVSLEGPSSITGEPVTTTTTTPDGTTVTTTTPTYNFDYSTNPLSITTTTTNTTTTYQNGVLTQTDTTTESPLVDPVVPLELEVPTDCEFMPTVCAFLEWYKAPAPPPTDLDMPMIEEDFQKSYSGPSLSSVCPAPFTVTTGAFGTLSIPVDPLCDLAGLIKYLVLSAAGLSAAFIISGTRRA